MSNLTRTRSDSASRWRCHFMVIVLMTIFVSALAAGTALALKPDDSMSHYVHNTWQVEDGLPQNYVTSILQTKDGYLWLDSGRARQVRRYPVHRFRQAQHRADQRQQHPGDV